MPIPPKGSFNPNPPRPQFTPEQGGLAGFGNPSFVKGGCQSLQCLAKSNSQPIRWMEEEIKARSLFAKVPLEGGESERESQVTQKVDLACFKKEELK